MSLCVIKAAVKSRPGRVSTSGVGSLAWPEPGAVIDSGGFHRFASNVKDWTRRKPLFFPSSEQLRRSRELRRYEGKQGRFTTSSSYIQDLQLMRES
ncbi:hypothetical protein RRG08_057623 [Elysia crispata]|uniref:Uncharacterized protein n=1 Tax=Elysia crispata TaxID=231223 RepID=A0AAE1DQE0_9GAST|nr:hypothetical protein RRG08_057623 [Elysia crispata]